MLRILISIAVGIVVMAVLYEKSRWVVKGSFLEHVIAIIAILSGLLVYYFPFWDS